MSSMVRTTLASLLLAAALVPLPVQAQNGAEWDAARAQLRAGAPSNMVQAIERWKMLNASDRFGFADYTGFLLSYPGFPEEAKFRVNAERALERESADPARIALFFAHFPPITNSARAQYARALYILGRPQASDVAREAWRGGAMSDTAEAFLSSELAAVLTPDDHDARMNALLWASAAGAAERQLLFTSPARRGDFLARLGLVNGRDPLESGVPVSVTLARDPGYLYARARMLRTSGRVSSAASLLATRPPLSALPFDQRKWIGELLAVARGADGTSAMRIAGSIDDTFAPGTDVSKLSFAIRDDYTSLMWLGGNRAMAMGNNAGAAPLFWRYGAAAKTPSTRSKGFYWAGRASAIGGNSVEANRYFELAAAYPDQYYGMLAMERLGRALPNFDDLPAAAPTRAEREAFNAQPLTAAVREVARESDWPTAVRFFREISDQAVSEGDHVLVADLAKEIGRRDLGVILGQAAHADGYGNFHHISFPLLPLVGANSWTMVHAITRQESQFAMNAISHAGARGLMQLMPGTAREQSGKMGMAYDAAALTRDAGYNIRLGDGYYARMMDYFGGSYPMAIGAYNAGAGNVNKFIRANGDPRYTNIDWVEWIEKVPLTETRGYIQNVLQNAVVYEAMNPDKASYRGPNPLSHFMGKRTPG
jgi:soluble lytic murein transglycosylase